MRRMRLFLILGLVIVAAVALFLVFGRGMLGGGGGQTAEPTPTPEIVTQDVIVITQKVIRGTLLDEKVLDVVPIQEDLLVPGMALSKDEVLGRRIKYDVEAGTLLFSNMLAEASESLTTTGSDWALAIPKGYLAVSIPISRLSSVSYAPRAGDHVNVIVTLSLVDIDSYSQSQLPNFVAAVIAPGPTEGGEGPTYLTAQVTMGGGAIEGRVQQDAATGASFYTVPSESQRPRLVSQTLIENVMVLHVGTFPLPEDEVIPTPTPAAATQAADGGGIVAPAPAADQEEAVAQAKPLPPDVITLVVTAQDAVTLNYLIFSGAQLSMALRGVNDDTRSQTEAATLQYILERHNIPIPVKLPYGTQPRVDFLAVPTLANDPFLKPTEPVK